MAAQRRDYLLRQLQDVAAMLARVIGLRLEGSPAEAGTELDQAIELLLGERAALIRRLDSATAASLMDSTATIVLYARLVHEEATQRGAGHGRAAELTIEALRRNPESEEARLLMAELRKSVPPDDVGPAYRSEFERAIDLP
jgi:hypothetical protein